MRDKIVIRAEHISKLYRLGVIGSGTLAEDMTRFWHRIRGVKLPDHTHSENGEDSIWALKDVSFEVAKGDVLGIIGKNGAGKSTLLKILSQITQPHSGEIRIKGKISSLLEVGTGFHPELSGRDNIFLNGAILGMKKEEIRRKFDEIVQFSGVEKFIDTPVKRYSSGMYVRLAFAVAAHLEPDILIVDEVLAVGDAEFQEKCLGKMKDVSGQGRTVLFVSHNIAAIRDICNRTILLSDGKILFEGSTPEAVLKYRSAISDESGNAGSKEFDIDAAKPAQFRILRMENQQRSIATTFEHVEEIFLSIELSIRENLYNTYVLVTIEDSLSNIVFASDSCENPELNFHNFKEGDYALQAKIPGSLLKPGEYFLTFSLTSGTGKPIDKKINTLKFSIIDTVTLRGVKKLYRSVAVVAPAIEWKLVE